MQKRKTRRKTYVNGKFGKAGKGKPSIHRIDKNEALHDPYKAKGLPMKDEGRKKREKGKIFPRQQDMILLRGWENLNHKPSLR